MIRDENVFSVPNDVQSNIDRDVTSKNIQTNYNSLLSLFVTYICLHLHVKTTLLIR